MSEAPDLKVVSLYDRNHRDPAATLRRIADEIERGDYGAVGSCAVVVMGDTVEVFGMGVDASGPSTAVLLQAGALRLIGSVERHGRE